MSEKVYDILRKPLQTKPQCTSYFKDLLKKTNCSVSFIVEIQSNSAYFSEAIAGPLTGAGGAD